MTDLNLALLETLCQTPGVAGFEAPIRLCIHDEISAHVDEVYTDNLGNLIALKRGKRSEKRVLVCAHMDEIGFLVRHIDENGFIRVTPLGGFDPKTLITQRVFIHGKADIVPAVFGTKAKHELSAEDMEKSPKLDDLYLDTGLIAEEVKAKLATGDVIVRDSRFQELGDFVSCKSMDNRVSVFAVVEAIKEITTPDFDTYFVFTVQEEVGLRGAATAARRLEPDIVLNLDVAPGSDVPGSRADKQVALTRQGVAIRFNDGGFITDRGLFKGLQDLAKAKDIPHQVIVRDGNAGTDTAMLQRAGKAARAACISPPLRYMHSYVESVAKVDIEATTALLKAFIEGLASFDEGA